ncbi:MAG: GSCFA domain-containing protein, partial [Bacteroidales bacterium]|nr:GSCFA domain-containing protein [Bacteroidales bacterium]
PFTAADVIVSDNFYTSFHHHSSFSRATEQEFLDNANAQLQMASDRFQKCDTVIVTLGTAHVFRHNKRDIIVSNCHKIPAQEFTRSRLSVDECTEYLESFVAAHPDKRWIFTVSPIRHLKDGAHGNQLSKATLLLAVDKICTKYSNAFYFPAYEIMMDELRDYRFYAEKMTHPTPQAIRYIFEKFCTFALDQSTAPLMKQAEKELKQARHRKIRG